MSGRSHIAHWIALAVAVGYSTPIQAEPVAGEGVQFSYDDQDTPTASGPDKDFPGIEKIFKNPALQSGLASGADAINRSIDSLMESVFYSLLDNKLVYQFNDNVFISLNLTRDVYSTSTGEYVVADRASFGPGFVQELGKVHGIPINFGSEAGVEVLDIYLTTDGKRVAEQQDLPWWRRTLNNWFGVLPILSAILPPSFNPNELYDPFHQLETPFSFPKSVDSFKRMPIGTIRSYSLSGGVHLGVDLGAGFIDKKTKSAIAALPGISAGLPYSVFKTGEHRINVLKRSENLAWVGLTDLKRTGHVLSPLIGAPLYFLTGTIPYWKGFKVNFFPLDVELSQALVDRFDQLYAYDLSNPWAQTAYLDAIKGDFTSSAYLTAQERKDGVKTGVLYLFTREKSGVEAGRRSSQNLAVLRHQREHSRSLAESKITDSRGTYYVLESNTDTNDELWNILVGSSENKVHQDSLLTVQRVEEKATGTEAQIRYVFSETANPIGLTLTLNIADRFLTTLDYRRYLAAIESFTRLPLNGMPEFNLVSAPRLKAFREQSALGTPRNQSFVIHPMEQHLGDFSATATIFVSTAVLEEVLRLGEPKWWEAFAQAYDQEEPERWKSINRDRDLMLQGRWLPASLLYPLRAINVRSPAVDAIREITERVAGLKRLSMAQDPLDARNALHSFFNSDYPERTARALLSMVDPEKFPRSVSFYAKPKGDGTDELKELYRSINGKIVRSRLPQPIQERYGWLKEKLGEFSPTAVRERRNRPHIGRIFVETVVPKAAVKPKVSKATKGIKPELPDETRRVRVRLHVKNMSPVLNGRFFVRIEQAGRLALGKLVLAEEVLNLPASVGEPGERLAPDTLPYDFYLNGSESPFQGMMYDRAMAGGGGDFTVSLSASIDGVVFSDERQFKFRFSDGKLMKPLEE